MTKTFKKSWIFLITVLFLVVLRMLAGFITLADNYTSWLFSFVLYLVGFGLIPVLLFKKWLPDEPVLRGFGLEQKVKPVSILIAIALGFLLYYCTVGISLIYQNILIMLGFTHVNSVGTIYSGIEVLIMEIITVGVLPAFFEEFIDRGLLLSVYENETNEKKIMIMMALLFAFGHQNIAQTIYTFLGGLVLAFLVLKTRSIIPSMIVHFINNSLSVVLDYSQQKGNIIGAYYDIFFDFLNNYFLLAIATWITGGFLIVVLLKRLAVHNGDIAEKLHNTSVKSSGNIRSEINTLFGFPVQQTYIPPARPKAYEYAPLVASLVVGILCTAFTFIWGVMR